MNKQLFKYALIATCAACVSSVFAGPDFRKEINAKADAVLKEKGRHAAVVEYLEGILQGADARTNAALRVFVDQKILGYCKMPSWFHLGRWDKAWSDATIPVVCAREIDAPDCPARDKLEFLRALANCQAGRQDYDAAIATARKAPALEGLKGGDLFKAQSLVADSYKWADRYDEAKAVLQKAAAFDAIGAARALADLAYDYGRDGDVVAAWSGLGGSDARLLWYYDHDREAAVDDAFAYVANTNNPAKSRRDILIRYFGAGKSDLAAKARAYARDMDFTGWRNWIVEGDFAAVYRAGDWALYAELAETFRTMPWFQDQGRYRAYLFSLVATGRGAEVAKLADEFLAKDAAAAKPQLKPFDRFRYAFVKALAADQDLIAVAKSANLDAKEYAQAVQIAAQWMLNLRRNEECERYSSAYRALIKDPPERRYAVKFFDKPVKSISDWRAIADTLEKSYVDVKMCGDLDNLVTDVATGRAEIEKTALDSKDARMEVTSLCDVDGLKLFLRVRDANARAVENGFAGGMGTEAYFAPGVGEPYICFSSSPREGVGFVFYTTYTHEGARRLEYADPMSPFALRQATEFTDDDYVLMVVLPWRAFYQKLPAAAGTVWRFECMADGYSWGGSQGIHESSSWGSLVFNLKDAEIAAIRRRLVYDTYKEWNRTGHGRLSSFDRWGDPVMGDPEFSAAVLKPLEAELKAQAAKVTLEMSDAEVNEVYEKGAKIWIGLDHVIDGLRRNYLLEKFTGL